MEVLFMCSSVNSAAFSAKSSAVSCFSATCRFLIPTFCSNASWSQSGNVLARSIFVVDKEGVVTQWNRVAEQTTGLTAQEAIGQLTGDLLPLDEAQGEQIAQAISSGRPVKAERLPITLRGHKRIVDALAYPLFADEADA